MATSRAKYVCLVIIALLFQFIAGCGGGSGSNGGAPPPPPPTPGFTISLSLTSLTLAQGSTSPAVQVSVAGQGGFTGSVSITLTGLTSGVTVSPASLSIASGSSATLTFSASSKAEITQQSVSLNGSSGTLAASTSLQLTISGTAVPDPFHAIGGALVHGFYDETRQLLFATNPGLNELEVISGQDFSIKARVPVPQPWGIDQMADGKTLVIGTAAQEIVTVDEDTLSVVQHPFAAVGNFFFTLFFPNVVAMANGKILIIGQEEGLDSSNILEGGQYVYEWDSTANSFSQLEPTGQQIFEVDSLARSADHKWAVFSADQFYVYSSASNSLTTVPLTIVNPPQDQFGVRGYAINADGSKIAVASATQVTFLDHSLTVLATTPIPGAFQTARTAVQFGADGSRLFLQYDFPVSIEEIDATNYNALGYVSGAVNNPGNDNLERMLTTDTKGRAYVGIDEGLLLVDLTQPPVAPSNGNMPGSNCPFLNAVLPLNSSQQVQLSSPTSGVSVYVGGQPAPLLSGGTVISIPPSSTAGPADVECIDTNGNTSVTLNGVSYGVDALAFSANLLPSTGNPGAYLFGFGFSAKQGETPSVTVGGRPASQVAPLANRLGTLEADAVQVPNGSAGQSADIVVSSSIGSGTLPSATTYYPAPTILPASGLLQLLYDSHRNLLYALKATEVEVLNPTTLQWQSPLVFPSAAMGTYNTMALSPDGSKLVVAGLAGTAPQFVVLDPSSVSAPSVLTYTGNASVGGSIAITKFNTIVMPGNPGLTLNPSTSTFTSLPYFGGDVIRASADGSHLFSAQLNVTSATVSSIDPSTYTVQSEGFGQLFWTDLAVSPDGSQFAAVDAPPYAAGDIVGFFDSSLHLLNTNAYPDFSPPDDTGVLGATFSPGGKVLVVALGDSIEFWDAAKGTLRARLMTPERLHVLVYPEGPVAPVLALDSTGQTIYALSTSGLTVLKLPTQLDQIPAVQWPLLAHSGSTQVVPRGPITSRMAAMRSNARN